MKKKKSKKKTSFISKTAMTVLTIILIILFFCIMSMVEKIQGTARVVNYAGLVRGKTQRIIKLEDAGEPQDTMIADINAYIDGLQNGSSELDLVRLDDRDFQDKMTELASYFEELKAEILLVREKGYENTAIIEKSETFFKICDEATGLAEAYSQRMASSLKKLEQVVVGDIIGLVFVIGMELIKAVRYAAMNRILQKKVYLDEATGLPNKNKCEEILEGSEGEALCRGKVTILFYDAAEDGGLHHFLMGFERFRSNEEAARNEKEQLDQYYEQMKQSIIENSHYAEALLETAEAVFAVDLTNDSMEQIFYHSGQKKFDLNIDLPCSYEKYCGECSAFVAEETLESYRIVDSSKKLLQRFENGDKQVVVEYQETDESGRRIWLQKTVLMSQDTVYDRKTKRESVVVHGMILFRDTSEFHSREEREKIQLQDAFRAADSASRAKTEFMNRMSHDVRTPINGIMGMLDIIRKNRQDEAKVDDCLDKINLSASHLLALVNDVLDMNKLESGKETIESVSFDLTHLMDDVSSLVNAQITEMGITHRTHRGELTHTRLIGSPLRLRQIMLNLFSNAIKYNKPGGTIDTYAGEVSCDGTRVVYEFRITDSGIGMSSEFIEKELFHPFTQEKSGARTQYKGTGLGMSIVKELIEKMQGTIEVTSQQGVGTTYVFRLPFYIDCEGQRIQEVKTRIAGKELVRFHVLLVEDNEINMEIAEFYLTDHGATVEEAWNGREAVEKYAANPQKFDVILMDLMMPVMGGLEAARQIRTMELPEAKQVPIIPMTAQSSEESKEGCRAAGMNSHLTKPIEPDGLVQTILETTEHAFEK